MLRRALLRQGRVHVAHSSGLKLNVVRAAEAGGEPGHCVHCCAAQRHSSGTGTVRALLTAPPDSPTPSRPPVQWVLSGNGPVAKVVYPTCALVRHVFPLKQVILSAAPLAADQIVVMFLSPVLQHNSKYTASFVLMAIWLSGRTLTTGL